MYTFENLIDDVKKEAAALKVYATKEELGRLELHLLRPDEPECCIYGLMCGDCYNKRAEFLKTNCTKRFVSSTNITDATVFEGQGMVYYSPVEAYILQEKAKNANLIAYLKSETETLDL